MYRQGPGRGILHLNDPVQQTHRHGRRPEPGLHARHGQRGAAARTGRRQPVHVRSVVHVLVEGVDGRVLLRSASHRFRCVPTDESTSSAIRGRYWLSRRRRTPQRPAPGSCLMTPWCSTSTGSPKPSTHPSEAGSRSSATHACTRRSDRHGDGCPGRPGRAHRDDLAIVVPQATGDDRSERSLSARL